MYESGCTVASEHNALTSPEQIVTALTSAKLHGMLANAPNTNLPCNSHECEAQLRTGNYPHAPLRIPSILSSEYRPPVADYSGCSFRQMDSLESCYRQQPSCLYSVASAAVMPTSGGGENSASSEIMPELSAHRVTDLDADSGKTIALLAIHCAIWARKACQLTRNMYNASYVHVVTRKSTSIT